MPPELKETSYAYLERLRFLVARIHPSSDQEILDIGCGTGKLVSLPLAHRFPASRFSLVENDEASLAQARINLRDRTNCQFFPSIPAGARFDAAIASEVLEHVDAPRAFLRHIRAHLKPGGKLLLTVPNGYGPSEALASLEFLLKIIRRKIAPKKPVALEGEDSFAYSPHIQFFGLSRLKNLLAEEGFTVVSVQSRMLVCGFPVSLLIDRFNFAQKANIWLGRVLPLHLSSDWMIEAQKKRE